VVVQAAPFVIVSLLDAPLAAGFFFRGTAKFHFIV